ncbi:cytochrome-c oxidase, cbb3-type subunit I [bacterium]|nr:cytochrome-c oxidase, cbb3-type subunit I [bacterium]
MQQTLANTTGHAEEAPVYDDQTVRNFVLASIFWGIIGMFVGVWIAGQLAWPALNFDTPWFSFGRLRPVHTNAVIFAFGGNVLFASMYYVVQRTCRVRMFNDTLSKLHFWLWQLVIVADAIALPLGFTRGKEYAEPEWPIALVLGVTWIIATINFFGTLAKRKEKHIYVANWFTMALLLGVLMLYVFNGLSSLPVSLTKSYSLYAGVQDALIQWWYGHNAVGFILTAGFLSLMYYFLPKQSGRPVYSYRLSILHFWALIFIYIWAGPHHLLYTALPEWAQTLGMTFSIMLLGPSWAGSLNGMLTLKGAWDMLRTDPIIKFMFTAITFYAMSTTEGSLLSIRSLNALSHYTDWTVGHVHSGALGWVAMISIGSMYYMIPRLWGKAQMYSTRLINTHFWMSTVGLLLYVAAMWMSGISQGLMWRATNADGSLTYTFAETVAAMHPFYVIRTVGGALFLAGMLVMAYNTYKTLSPRARAQSATKPSLAS